MAIWRSGVISDLDVDFLAVKRKAAEPVEEHERYGV